jgi:hypothetical protein
MREQTTQLDGVKLGIVANTCACFNLRKASRTVTQLYDEILQPSGLLATQFTLLGRNLARRLSDDYPPS